MKVYSGRFFSDAEIDRIRQWIREDPSLKRTPLSRKICQSFGWVKPNGTLTALSCRMALLRMERDGLLVLPPSQCANTNRSGAWRIRYPELSAPQPSYDWPLSACPNLHLRPAASRAEEHLWNDFIQRYNYLGHKPLPGAQIRYFAFSGETPLTCLGFGASAWKVAPRDTFIGRSHDQRKAGLSFIVNNARFLIFPWIKTKCLASQLLSLAARRIQHDWRERFAFAPVLIETFVECDRFKGTCYRAANWIHVGKTQGRGKLDVNKQFALPVKDIFLYPLQKNFRSILSSSH
jgi:hypothetical protein